MRRAQKVAMLATVAIAAATSTAVAQPQEGAVHNQSPRLVTAQEVHAAGDTACPSVVPSPPPVVSPTATAGGCRLHFTGSNLTLTAHLSAGGTEVLMMTCDIEFDLRLDSAGEGWISHLELTPGTTGSCTRKACGQTTPPTSEGRAWQIYLQETEVAGVGPRETAFVVLCTEALDGTGLSHCHHTIPVSQPAHHRYRLTLDDLSGHGSIFPHCEHTGTLDSEAALGTTGEGQLEQNVEIRHN